MARGDVLRAELMGDGMMAQKERSVGMWRIAPLMLALVLGVTACNKTQESQRPPEPGDIAVARVDGETIWSSDVRNEAVAQGQIGPGEPLDMTSDLFSRTLGEVIDQRLLAKAARAKNLDKSISAQRRLQAATDRILGDMLVESSIDRNIDEKAIKEQYDEQVKLSRQSEEIRARIIVTRTQGDAAALLKQVQGGGLFEALAMERSIDQATRFNGGDMGYLTTDILPQNFKNVLLTAKVGDTVGPVQAENGWAILRVEDRRPEQMPTLEEERPIIMRYLIYNQVAGLLKDLEDHSKVERLLPKSAHKDSDTPPSAAPKEAFDASAAATDATDSVSDSAASSSAAPAKPATADSKAKSAAATAPVLLPGIPDPTRGHHLFAPAKATKPN